MRGHPPTATPGLRQDKACCSYGTISHVNEKNSRPVPDTTHSQTSRRRTRAASTTRHHRLLLRHGRHSRRCLRHLHQRPHTAPSLCRYPRSPQLMTVMGSIVVMAARMIMPGWKTMTGMNVKTAALRTLGGLCRTSMFWTCMTLFRKPRSLGFLCATLRGTTRRYKSRCSCTMLHWPASTFLLPSWRSSTLCSRA